MFYTGEESHKTAGPLLSAICRVKRPLLPAAGNCVFPARRSAGGGDRDGPPESRRPPGKRFYQCIGKDAEKPADAFLASRRKSVKMLFRLVIGTMRKAGPEGAGFSHLPLRQNGGRFPGLCPPCAGGSANEISHLRQAESKPEPIGPARLITKP